MSNEEFLKLLREACSVEEPELNDATVDAFLSIPSECEPQSIRRIEARFVEKLFGDVHREPVRTFAARWPFNRWLESMRESVRLTRDDIAAALNRDREFIERLENGDQLPWDFKPSEIGGVVCLFRVHMTAVAELIANSVAVFQSPSVQAVARAHRGRTSEARGRSTKRALDLYVARNAPTVELGTDINAWLEDLRKDLHGRQAQDLL